MGERQLGPSEACRWEGSSHQMLAAMEVHLTREGVDHPRVHPAHLETGGPTTVEGSCLEWERFRKQHPLPRHSGHLMQESGVVAYRHSRTLPRCHTIPASGAVFFASWRNPIDSIDVVLPEALRSRQKFRSIRSESLIINHSEVVVHALAGYIEG